MIVESEKLLEKKLCDKVGKLGGWAIKFLPFLVSGLPDRICLLPGGVIFFAEIKTSNKEATPLQKLIHKRLRKLGFIVYVIDTSEQIKEIIEKL